MAISAARWMAVGMTSLEDWQRLTWSLGWTGLRVPRGWPRSSLARLAITSLAFMLVEVPEPVWKMSTTNSASKRPSATSCAAWIMASMAAGSRAPSKQPQVAVGLGRRALDQAQGADEAALEAVVLMGKFCTARWVEAP